MYNWRPFRKAPKAPVLSPRRSHLHELPLHIADSSHRLLGHSTAVYNDFVSFVGRKNVLEVAVALIIGSAFTAVSRSLVSDIFTPLLSLMPFFRKHLVNKFVILRCGTAIVSKKGDDAMLSDVTNDLCKYATLEQAYASGAITLAYGRFLESALQFFFSAVVLYLLVKTVQLFWGKQIVHETKKCEYCFQEIKKISRRCTFCTTWLDGREESKAHDWGLGGIADTLFHTNTNAIGTRQKHKTFK